MQKANARIDGYTAFAPGGCRLVLLLNLLHLPDCFWRSGRSRCRSRRICRRRTVHWMRSCRAGCPPGPGPSCHSTQLLTSRIHRSKDTTTGEYFLIINSLFCRGELSIADIPCLPVTFERRVPLNRVVHTPDPHVEDVGRPPIGLDDEGLSPLPGDVLRTDVVNVAVVNGAELTRLEIVILPFEFTVLISLVAPDADDVGLSFCTVPGRLQRCSRLIIIAKDE